MRTATFLLVTSLTAILGCSEGSNRGGMGAGAGQSHTANRPVDDTSNGGNMGTTSGTSASNPTASGQTGGASNSGVAPNANVPTVNK
jgi:hypothetical protein